MTNDGITMTRERFKALIEAYGADLERWPHDERLAAHGFAGRDPTIARLIAEARALDTLLGAVPLPRPRTDLQAVILAAAVRTDIPRTAPFSLRGLLGLIWPEAASWKPVSVLASAVALGVVLGLNVMGGPGGAGANEDLLADAVPFLSQDVSGL